MLAIRALEDNRLLGDLNLDVVTGWMGRNAFVGINVGNRADWGKGYGTDAMKLCLQYAFMELGAQRVSLGLHEYNSRALKSYEKTGFKLEGRMRQEVMREGYDRTNGGPC